VELGVEMATSIANGLYRRIKTIVSKQDTAILGSVMLAGVFVLRVAMYIFIND
jgi:hypothetical protein